MTAAGLRAAITRLEGMPARPPVRLALAEAEFRLAVAAETGPAEAMARLRRAGTHDPYLPKVYLHLGRLLHRAGSYREALVEYRRAVGLAPASRRAYLLMALALLELGRPEQDIGRLLIGALDAGDADGLRTAVAELDALAERQRTAGDPAGGADRRSRRGAPAGAGAAPDTWQAALYEQLARPKPARDRITACLDAGAALIGGDGAGVTEYATACALLIACGQPPAQVRTLMTRGGLDRMTDHPAAVLLTAVLELAEAATPADFVCAATGRLRAGHLPPVLVCWLHFAAYGPERDLPPADAVRLLGAYPEQLRELDCFGELRLAVLDGYARRAWSAERFAQARLMWRETIPLDRNRVPVALNLALLAARTRSAEDYPAAWGRLAELLYLHAAGAGDPQVLLAERRMLHLALSQQSMRRYCESPAAERIAPPQLTAWLADQDALEVWLREWDLYYLNSRLGFRSPLHVLGLPPDATAEQVGAERDALRQHVEQALAAAPWAGARAFADLATARVEEAYEQALDPVARADDPYIALEEARAKALSKELLDRARWLLRLMAALDEDKRATRLPLACAIARKQLALPRGLVRRAGIEHGYFDRDIERDHYVEQTEIALVNLAGRAAGEADDAARPQLLAAVEECVTTLPHRPEPLLFRSSLLRLSGRGEEAYIDALTALRLPGPIVDWVRGMLIEMIDRVALDEIPDRRPADAVQLEVVITAARRALRLFPRSHQVRLSLARALRRRAGGAGEQEAAEVLAEGIAPALTDEQRAELDDLLAGMPVAAPAVRRRVRDLLGTALAGVQRALDDLDADPTPQAAQAARAAVEQAVPALRHAREMAGTAKLAHEVTDLDEALARLARLRAQFGEGTE
ncbi:MAG: hypothetical protein V7637_6393 [Mycobacteriales bacterium]